VPFRIEIQCECAFTYMNAVFRRNLTDALAVNANHVATASDTGGALGDGREIARFCRTTATCIWGVSDPLPAVAWGRDRGVAEGVAHAPDDSVTDPASRADCDTGGKERRAIDRGEVADRKVHRHFTH
jgi:hypothetical protein